MKTVPLLQILFCATLLGFSAGCAPRKVVPPPAPVKTAPLTYWKGEGVKGAASIVVDLSEQHVYFYKDTELVGETRCSSGKKGFSTPTGDYRVTQKDRNHVSNLYGNFVDAEGTVVQRDVDMSKMTVPEGCTFAGAKMPFYMRFHDGYGLHAGHVPSHPASHGCVRLPRIMAEHFYAHSSVGTPVTVRE